MIHCELQFIADDQAQCTRDGCRRQIRWTDRTQFPKMRCRSEAPPTERKPGCRTCGQKQMLAAWTLPASWSVTLDCPGACKPGVYLFDVPLATEAHAELESRGWWFPMQGRYEQAELVFERRRDGREKAALQFCGPGCGPRWSSGWLAAGSFSQRQELYHEAGELPPVLIESSREPA